jgi:outer membrane protein assembly factor BamD
MIRSVQVFLSVVFLSMLLYGCNGYNKLLKSKDFDKKYEAALDFYEKEDYFKAQQLFDELLVVFRGTPRAEEVYFKYAYTFYHMGDYLSSAYHFQRYALTFPKSSKTEEALYMSAYSKYKDSPKWSLDQTSTQEAITQLQTFINIYPESERIAQCNDYIDELRAKLDRKDFERAKLYHTTGYYLSAITSLNLFIKNNPGSAFREDAMFLLLDAHFRYASRSVPARRSERFQDAQGAYRNLVAAYPESRYRQAADQIHRKVSEELIGLAESEK